MAPLKCHFTHKKLDKNKRENIPPRPRGPAREAKARNQLDLFRFPWEKPIGGEYPPNRFTAYPQESNAQESSLSPVAGNASPKGGAPLETPKTWNKGLGRLNDPEFEKQDPVETRTCNICGAPGTLTRYGQQLELCTTHFEEREADRKAHRDRVSARIKEEDKARRRDMFLSAIQESPSRISKIRRNPAECIACGKVTPAGSRSFNVDLVDRKAIKAAGSKVIGSRAVRVCEECVRFACAGARAGG